MQFSKNEVNMLMLFGMFCWVFVLIVDSFDPFAVHYIGLYIVSWLIHDVIFCGVVDAD